MEVVTAGRGGQLASDGGPATPAGEASGGASAADQQQASGEATEARAPGGAESAPKAGAVRRPNKRAAAAVPVPPPVPEEKKTRKRRETKSAPEPVLSDPATPAASSTQGAAAGDGAEQQATSIAAATPAAQPTPAVASGVPGNPTAQEEVPAHPEATLAAEAKEVQRLQKDIAVLQDELAKHRKRFHLNVAERKATRKVLSSLLVQVARSELADEREHVAAAKYQLGACRSSAPLKHGPVWDGGYEADFVTKAKERNKEDRSAVEKWRRQLTKQERARSSTGENGREGERADGAASGDEADELWEAREISNCRLSFVGREETQMRDREARLQVERLLHLKRVHRLEAAERSNFRTYPLLADERYQLLNMIGRGGFSEVYRAYDLELNKFCAVKIHELGKDMTDQQRQSYIRRAMREYEIQKSLKHPRVVTLQDCFAISTKAFGTVLELCEGETLDEHIKRHGVIPEREARGIVIQILSGLKYMNTNGRKIIHYDLKPSNLFFYSGEIKIADFGLSKVVHETSGGDSIELTSQGAGTYWYLPPECFVEAGQAEQRKISNKVDVWSTGVIFFELLFNRRPFGHGLSQEALLRATMAASQRFAVDIPSVPKVSVEAQKYLRRLLTVNREERPDVLEAFNDPYLRSSRYPGRAASTGPAAAASATAGATG